MVKEECYKLSEVKQKVTLDLEAMAESIPQKKTEKTRCRLNFIAQYYL